jgi:hypothetical protein
MRTVTCQKVREAQHASPLDVSLSLSPELPASKQCPAEVHAHAHPVASHRRDLTEVAAMTERTHISTDTAAHESIPPTRAEPFSVMGAAGLTLPPAACGCRRSRQPPGRAAGRGMRHPAPRPGRRGSAKDRCPRGRRRHHEGRRSWSPSPPREFKAFSAVCTHQGCGRLACHNTIDCACHNSKFALADGAVVSRTRHVSHCPPRRSPLTATSWSADLTGAVGEPPYSVSEWQIRRPTARPRAIDPARPRGLSVPRRLTAGHLCRQGQVAAPRLSSYFQDIGALHPRTATHGPHRRQVEWTVVATRSRRCNSNTAGSRSSIRASTSNTATTSPTPISRSRWGSSSPELR